MNNTYEECIQAYLVCIIPCIRTSRFLEVSLIPQQVSCLLFLKMTRFL